MSAQGDQRIVAVLQFFLRQHVVDVIVAGSADPKNPCLDVLTIEQASIAPFSMPSTRYQMMFGQSIHGPLTELAIIWLGRYAVLGIHGG